MKPSSCYSWTLSGCRGKGVEVNPQTKGGAGEEMAGP